MVTEEEVDKSYDAYADDAEAAAAADDAYAAIVSYDAVDAAWDKYIKLKREFENGN